VEILLSSEELAVFGGPASIDLNVDFGPQGQRGTLIFTGNGKPTDPDIQLVFNNTVYNSQSAQPFDLYINLNPDDFEYLFLYQYGYVGGVLTWSKVLRLIPNTAIANLPIIFYNGQAVTFTPAPGAPVSATAVGASIANVIASPVGPSPTTSGMLWLDISTGASGPWELKIWTYIQPLSAEGWVPLGTVTPGLSFPVGDYFDLTEVILPAQGPTSTRNKVASFNVQYVILNDTPVSSGLTLGDLTQPTGGSKIYLPVNIKAVETGLTGFALEDVTWKKITGVKNLSIVVTANIGSLPISEEES
jgi:hypothetical protein